MEQKKLFMRLHLSISSTYTIRYIKVPKYKKKKASGHDLISHRMLKNTANTVSIPLKIIFDYSIQTSTFPDHWKLARYGTKETVYEVALINIIDIYNTIFCI
jgi:hypothetical protein